MRKNLQLALKSIKMGFLHKPIVHLLLIIIVGFVAYSNTFHVPFHLDDHLHISENPLIKDLRFFLAPSTAKEYNQFGQYDTLKMRYMGLLTFALNYKLHGLNVTGYHIFNFMVHIINALLVYWLVALTFKTPFFKVSVISVSEQTQKTDTVHYSPIHLFTYLPLFIALLFVCHPIQTQAVTYIIQRFASLATMFFLLSVVSYIKSRLSRLHATRYTLYAVSVIFAILAMKTKEIAFTLPFVIALYEFMFFEGKFKKRILYLAPILLTLLIIPLGLIDMNRPLGEMLGSVDEITRVAAPTMSRWDYLFTQFRVIVTYIRLIFLPINQNIAYDYPIYQSFFEPQVFLSFLFLFSIFCFAVYLFYRSRITHYASRITVFGIFWFFITLSVESSIIPIADVIFEHRVYLPSVGAVIAMTTSLFIIANRLGDRYKRTILSGLVVVVIVLTGTTYARNIVWQDEVSLWEDMVRKSPNNAKLHRNLGSIYGSRGLIDKAIEHFQIALQLKPHYAEVHYNLGLAYLFKGLTDKAIEHYQIALQLKPDYAEAHKNLGRIYLQKGDIDKARREFEMTLRINPNDYEAQQYLNHISTLK